MNSTQRRRRDRLARACAYHTANAADFPEGSKGAKAAAEMAAAIADADGHDTARESSASALQQATVGKNDARGAILAYLRAISDTARTIAAEHAEFRGMFQFSGASVSDRALLTTARDFAAAGLPHKSLFVEYDMKPDFLEEFTSLMDAFEQQMDIQISVKGGRVSANASLEGALGRGEAALERFDTAVNNKYRGNEAKLAAWKSARHLERSSRGKRKGNGAQQTPPAQS